MNIYIYSDESGVFDKKHNDTYVFGGVIALGKDEKEVWSRRYAAAEKVIRQNKAAYTIHKFHFLSKFPKSQSINIIQFISKKINSIHNPKKNCHKELITSYIV